MLRERSGRVTSGSTQHNHTQEPRLKTKSKVEYWNTTSYAWTLVCVAEPPTLILQFQYKDHKIPVFFGRNPYYMVEPQLFGGLY